MKEEYRFIIFMGVAVAIFVLIMIFGPKLGLSSCLGANNQETSENVDNTSADTDDKADADNTTEIETKYSFKLLDDYSSPSDTNLIYENENIKVIFDENDAVIKNLYIKDSYITNKKQYKKYNLDNITGREPNDIVQVNKEINNHSAGTGALKLKFGNWFSNDKNGDMTLKNMTGEDKYHHTFDSETNTHIFTARIQKVEEESGKAGTIYTVIKKFKFYDDSNIVKFDVEITSDSQNSQEVIDFDPNSEYVYSIGWGPGIGVDTKFQSYEQKRRQYSFSYLENSKLKFINNKSKKIVDKNTKFGSFSKDYSTKWVASNGHYFASVLYPEDKFKKYDFFFDYSEQNSAEKNAKYTADVYCGISELKENENKIATSYYLYAGPKIRKYVKEQAAKIDTLSSDSNLHKITNPMPYMGFIGEALSWLGDFLGFLLKKLNLLFRNYGVSLIIFTILIKLILSPLTFKSMKSQEKMSMLQPKMQELKEKYKDDPQVLNQETMKMYKKEGINPMGGCLPMLLQMPILFAMYRALNTMVELRGAKFMLWIKDLSSPDAIWTFKKGLNLLNFIHINSINILPIVMVATQMLATIITPQGDKTNKQAQMMMWLMPLIFFFILYDMPSGLVVYWTVMNVLNIGQQFLLKYLGKKKAANISLPTFKRKNK